MPALELRHRAADDRAGLLTKSVAPMGRVSVLKKELQQNKLVVWLEKYPDFKSVTLLQRFNTPFDLIITLSLVRSTTTDNSSRHFPPNTRLHGGRRHNVVCCIYLPGVKYRMFRNGGASAAVTGFGVRARE